MKEIEKFLNDLNFDEEKVNKGINKVNAKLKQYIDEKILPEYELNDGGHNSEHVKYVLKRAFELADGYEINYDILYTCVCFHDVACHIDRDNHEVLSAQRAYEDDFLNGFFSIIEMKKIKEAIEDHRASSKIDPRSIYGKIVSSADRNDSVEQCLRRSYTYGKKLNPTFTDDEIFENAYQVLFDKFGISGYAKFYFKDKKYDNFLYDIRNLLKNKEEFINTQRKYIDKLRKKGKI